MNYLNSSLVESRAEASVEVRKHNAANVRVWVSLPLVGAPPTSSSSSLGRRLWQRLQ